MITFIQVVDDDTNDKILGIVREIRKQLKKENSRAKFNKQQCIEDMIAIAMEIDRDELVNQIIAVRKKKGIELSDTKNDV